MAACLCLRHAPGFNMRAAKLPALNSFAVAHANLGLRGSGLLTVPKVCSTEHYAQRILDAFFEPLILAGC
jgi:hypothetical protein